MNRNLKSSHHLRLFLSSSRKPSIIAHPQLLSHLSPKPTISDLRRPFCNETLPSTVDQSFHHLRSTAPAPTCTSDLRSISNPPLSPLKPPKITPEFSDRTVQCDFKMTFAPQPCATLSSTWERRDVVDYDAYPFLTAPALTRMASGECEVSGVRISISV